MRFASMKANQRIRTRNAGPSDMLATEWIQPVNVQAKLSRLGKVGLIEWLCLCALALASTGCYAPLHSFAVPACELPDNFRMPIRTAGPPLNFAALTLPPPTDYLLGQGDTLEV